MIRNWCKQNKSWKDIMISGNTYMISVTNDNDTWQIVLTNLIEIWIETLTEEVILCKCEKLNPLLNMDVFDWNGIITNILNNVPKYIAEASENEIKLRVNLEGNVFKFMLNLTKGTPQQFWENITQPLCLSSMEVLRQHNILLNLVKKKDEEIAEYKAEGAELIRKNIQTVVFDENLLKMKFLIPELNDCTNAFRAMINFYNTIDLHNSHVENKSNKFTNVQESVTNKTGECKEYTEQETKCLDTNKEKNVKDNTHDTSASTSIALQNSNEKTSDGAASTSKERNAVKNNSNINVSNNKIKHSPLILHKCSKKIKKNLSDFIS